jgi:DNA-binding MarR family transcriptional regulator
MNNAAVKFQPRERHLSLDHFIPCRLSDLSQSVTRSIATIYHSRFGLTPAECRVLVVLGREPGLSAVEVASRTQLDKVAVSRAVTKLVARGQVERRFADADRRRSILTLTEEGRRLLGEIEPVALDFEDRLLGDLSAAEVAMLNRVIEKLLVSSHWLDDMAS